MSTVDRGDKLDLRSGLFQIDLLRISRVEDAAQLANSQLSVNYIGENELTQLGLTSDQISSFLSYRRKYGPIKYWIELENLDFWDKDIVGLVSAAFSLEEYEGVRFDLSQNTTSVFGRYDSENESYRLAFSTNGTLKNASRYAITLTQSKSDAVKIPSSSIAGYFQTQLSGQLRLSVGTLRLGSGLGILQSQFLNLANGFNSLTPFYSHSFQTRGYAGVNADFAPRGTVLEYLFKDRTGVFNQKITSKAWSGIFKYERDLIYLVGYEVKSREQLIGVQINKSFSSNTWIGSLYGRRVLGRKLFLQAEFVVDNRQGQYATYLIKPIDRVRTLSAGIRVLKTISDWTGEAYRMGSQPETMGTLQLEIKPTNYLRQLIVVELGQRNLPKSTLTVAQAKYLWSKSNWGSVLLQTDVSSDDANFNLRIFKNLYQDDSYRFQIIALGNAASNNRPQLAIGLDIAKRQRWYRWGARSYLALQQRQQGRLYFPEYQVDGLNRISSFQSDQMGNYAYFERSFPRKEGSYNLQLRAGIQSSIEQSNYVDISCRLQYKMTP